MLFIAGAGSSAAVWPEPLLKLPRQTPCLLDLPGHGDARPPGRRSITDYANQAAAVVRSVAPTRVVLVGHSLGAAVALTTARLLAGRIDGLILLGAAARLPVSATLFELLSSDFPAAAHFVGRYGVSRDADPSLADRCAAELLRTGQMVTTGDFLACDQFDGHPWLAEIALPALVISGENDRLVRPSAAVALAEALPSGEFLSIGDAGHFVMWEQPQNVAAAMAAFLEQLS